MHRARRQRIAFEQRLEAWTAAAAVEQERLRIARDLHDLASHGLGLITVRAAATGYLTGEHADSERERAMADIERIGRATTLELRRMLALLRTPGTDPAPLRPADTLTELPAIVRNAEQAGLIIRFELADLGPVSGSAQLTVCTVVREALANTLRHAGPTTARVTITAARGIIDIDIRDDGPAPGWRTHPGAGHGLTGLRERLAVHGGALSVGSYGTGYRVHATLPREATT
ncbi:sensor histidine kinase [Leucobacter sp. M11]|uniref:sensor histidine kinase n=1 Tax=Leucobacter sp. M11 TaxID=2993565 RepID=UPI002D7F45E2|nr:histidine kinase [Leucobacter sp. M11]MEB4616198.1 histidine kinase [Leucobacter sp. M11]